jgi:hypothetical protein
MNKRRLASVLIGSLALTTAAISILPIARITIKIIDTNGTAVVDANVSATFQNPELNPTNWGTGRDNKIETGKTDPAGEVTFEGHSDGELGGGVRKRGYYRGWWEPYKFSGRIEDRWQPWGVTLEVILKDVKGPTPMYARRVNRGLPTQNERTAFDMGVGDYVGPYGKGKLADIIFQLEVLHSAKNPDGRKLAVNFTNPRDGVLPFSPTEEARGSELRSPYSAPDEGYLPNWAVTRGEPTTPSSANYDPQKHGYFFRIRTQIDANGKIVSANYGKIYGDFMNFTYYLNPTPNDRNIEFDPKRNLFTNLKPAERVTDP